MSHVQCIWVYKLNRYHFLVGSQFLHIISRLKTCIKSFYFFFSLSVVRCYQAYTEPGDGPIATQGPPRGDINPLHPPASGSEEEESLPLGEKTLSRNLGIPIVVVVTKVRLRLYCFNFVPGTPEDPSLGCKA